MPSYKEKKQKLKQLVKKQEEERIKKIQQEGHNFVDSDLFKRAEKHYKFYMHLQTDYSDVLDLQKLKSSQICGHQVYKLQYPQGAYLIKNFVDIQTQYQVGFQALNEFIFRPYRTNLDGTNGLYHQNANNQKNQMLAKQIEDKKQNKQQKIQTQVQTKIQSRKIDVELQNKKVVQGIDFQNKQLPYYLNQKIRMANLGYQYDWPHRSYPATKVPIPQTVTNLTSKAKQIYQHIKKQEVQYHGEAVIVNYYKLRDYMTGHLDDGEQDQINPIFSFCFGLSCIFLIGAPTRDKQPVAVRLDAGDLLIMSGFSRICYHGVPRIIEDSYQVPKENQNRLQQIRKNLDLQIQQKKNRKDLQFIQKRYLNSFDHISNYYKQHRLNINVRQVWVRKGQKDQHAGKQDNPL